jgi:hypothetical protein
MQKLVNCLKDFSEWRTRQSDWFRCAVQSSSTGKARRWLGNCGFSAGDFVAAKASRNATVQRVSTPDIKLLTALD